MTKIYTFFCLLFMSLQGLMKTLLQFQRDNGLRVSYLDDATLKALGL